jgi:hypothetical protein
MNTITFGTFLLLSGLAVLPPSAYAQSESVPPNAIESLSTSDHPRTQKILPDSNVSFSFGQATSSTGAQVEIPLAQRVDNAANNPPVDKATTK